MFDKKVDIDDDGEADGIFLSEEDLRTLLLWEADDREAFLHNLEIIESFDSGCE